MKLVTIYALALWMCLFLAKTTLGQFPHRGEKPVYECTDKGTFIHLSKTLKSSELDSLIQNFDLAELQLHYLMQNGKLHADAEALGWKIESSNGKQYKLAKLAEPETQLPPSYIPGKPGEPLIPWEDRMLIAEFSGISHFNHDHFYPSASWGINKFKQVSVIQEKNGECTFILFGFEQAQQVRLSGSFNAWSKSGAVMHRTSKGWECKLNLPPGKHLYKYIVDGSWHEDPMNELRESDSYRGYNSVVFVNNKKFTLNALPKANKVYLIGNFNGWKDKEIEMRKEGEAWAVDIYLAEGTYAYRFKADKKYFLDPSNPISLTDGEGFENSYTSIGDTMFFELDGFEQANEVFVAGSFNQWNPTELKLSKTNGRWKIPYVLGPGIYTYKFVVDGKWFIDPRAALFVGEPPYDNSVLVVKPNHKFELLGYENAKSVIVAGSFNDWDEQFTKMRRTPSGWELPYYLAPGKHTYKFKVDNQWILDPANSLWEENEYQTGNSVLWMKP